MDFSDGPILFTMRFSCHIDQSFSFKDKSIDLYLTNRKGECVQSDTFNKYGTQYRDFNRN